MDKFNHIADPSCNENNIRHKELTEDERDACIADEAYQEYIESGCKSTPIDDFWREVCGE